VRIVLADVRTAKLRLQHCKCKRVKPKRNAPNPTPWEGNTLLEKLTEIETRVNDILLYIEDEETQ